MKESPKLDLNLKKLNLVFSPGRHVYTLNGERIPGCSTISGMLPKDWMMSWAAKMATQAVAAHWKPDRAYSLEEIEDILQFAKAAPRTRRDKAAEKGTMAHTWLETYVKSGIQPALPDDPAVLNCIKLFLAWEKENKVEWLHSELVVASEEHMFGGKLDAIARINGILYLVDFKTSAGIFTEYYVQTAGYLMAMKEMGLKEEMGRLILWFPKEGNDFEPRVVPTPLEEDWECFLNAKGLYLYDKRRKKEGGE